MRPIRVLRPQCTWRAVCRGKYNGGMTSLPNRPEVRPVSMSFQQWLQQGEMIYQNALREFHAIEAQLDELEQRLVAKQAEVNQVAAVIGKPPVEGTRRVSAQIVSPP